MQCNAAFPSLFPLYLPHTHTQEQHKQERAAAAAAAAANAAVGEEEAKEERKSHGGNGHGGKEEENVTPPPHEASEEGVGKGVGSLRESREDSLDLLVVEEDGMDGEVRAFWSGVVGVVGIGRGVRERRGECVYVGVVGGE